YHVVAKKIPASAAVAAARGNAKVKTVQGERISLSFKNGKIVLNRSARVVIADVGASNGVIHAINAVIVPPSLAPKPAQKPTKTVVEIAAGNPDFSTLVALVSQAGLVETLSGPGPFTVFAPTNAAFEKLPAGTVDTLLKPENKATLTKVLTYHVVAGTYDSRALAKLIKKGNGQARLKTVSGGTLTAMMDGSNIVLRDEKGGTATVTVADV